MSTCRYLLPGLFCSLLLTSCGPSPKGASIGTTPGVAQALETDAEVLRALKTISYVPAAGVTGPNGSEFFVHDRRAEIGQFPCTSCHISLPASGQAQTVTRKMHVDVQLRHAKDDLLSCTTCHDEDQPDALHLLNGKTVGINASHKVCAQCHFQQAADWAGGAHGKRLAGWRGRRVINSCTDCHNPHDPAFQAKQPLKGPRFPHEG